jgi:hypothetical protein
MLNICQFFIFLFGCLSIWFISRTEKWKRWGYIIGLAGQPFWLYMTITNKQWWMLALTIAYIYSWSSGIYNYWIKNKEKSFNN